MNFKYKVGDLTFFKEARYPTNIYPFPARRPLIRLFNTIGLILETCPNEKVYSLLPPPGYDKPTPTFDGYKWYSIVDSKIYFVHEFELESFKP